MQPDTVTNKELMLLALGIFSGFLAGIPSSFLASAWYDRSKEGRSRKAEIAREREALWRNNLSSENAKTRTKAFQELIVIVLEKFIYGNVFFALSGMSWILDVF